MTEQIYVPSEQLKQLDRLIGTWRVSGEANGQISYEWMDGGFFLIQHVDVEHGQRNIGMEIIGQERMFGAQEASADIKSRYYGSGGETFDYVYELEGNTLTIWGGEKGSPAYFRGTFSADDMALSGRWHWPGGGYDANMTRLP